MNNLLLVWENIPESLDMYVLPLGHEMVDTIRKCHGKILNIDEYTEDLELVSEWLDTDEAKAFKHTETWRPITDKHIIEVVVSGIML